MSKLVRLVALDPFGEERGAIDGEVLTISATDDGELVVLNGMVSLFESRPTTFGWEDLVPDFRRGERIHLKLEIVDTEGEES